MKHINEKIEEIQQWQRTGRLPKPFHPETLDEVCCRNCGTLYHGNYCPNCGQSAKTKRLTLKGVIQDGMQVVSDLDSRYLRTIVELIYRPGYMIRDYVVSGKRRPYAQPISLLFLMSTAYIICVKLLHLEIGEANINLDNSNLSGMADKDVKALRLLVEALSYLVKLMLENKALSTLFALIAYILPFKLLFRKTEVGSRMNYMEHFYLLCYLGCQGLLFSLLWLFFQKLLGLEVSSNLLFDSSLILYIWGTHQFFDIGWWRSIKLNVVAWILSMLLYLVCGIIFGGLAFGLFYFYRDVL